jgi:CheY-like chemotaxis protein
MKCPRCQNAFNATPDATGIVICPGCGSRLRTRPAAAPGAGPAETPGPGAAGPRPAPAPKPPAPVPGPSLVKTSPVAVPAAAPAPLRGPSPDPAATLDAVLQEIRALREGQEEVLELLRRPAAGGAGRGFAEDSSFAALGEERPAPAAPAVRSRRRKTVLLIDDDPQALAAAVEALGRAEVPVRTATEGNASLAMIAEEKPDVIVMELGLTGSMAGKDVINMIKATMEWVDVPIVLYTRMPIESQREARQIHGADEYVLKGPGSADAMVARVIAIFRKG